MKTFTIKWEVRFYQNEDYDDETHIVETWNDAEDLESLLKELEEDITNFTPEYEVESSHDGDLNIEYLAIRDENDFTVWWEDMEIPNPITHVPQKRGNE